MSSSSGPDRAARLSVLQSTLIGPHLDALVISSLDNIRYLTGFGGSSGLLLITRRACTLITDGRYELAVRAAISDGTIAPVGVARVAIRYDLTLAECLSLLGGRKVGFEAAHVTVATLQAWQKVLPDVIWSDTHGLVERQRLIKDPWEQEVFRRAGKALAGVALRLREWVRAGESERDVAAAIEHGLMEAGFAKPAFPTIVASGPNSAHPHARPTARPLASGDLVVLDFGGELDGYCVDLTRMAVVGPASAEAEALYASVRVAHQAALDAVRPGIETSAIDAAARGVLESRGLGEAFLHGTGHGLGLEVHEAPRIARSGPEAPELVEVGMVFTIEPGAYLPELGGVRLEDDVLVTAMGCEVLTEAPRDLLVV
ncbi:MAG: Xaa-Pro peptidase family protein [Vicinamibacterales bacterium]